MGTIDAFVSSVAAHGGFLPMGFALAFALVWALRALFNGPTPKTVSRSCSLMLAEAFAREHAIHREALEAHGALFYEAMEAGCLTTIGNSWCAITSKGRRLSKSA
jgi:hypothetical protein